MAVALVERSADANAGGGRLLSDAVLSKYCLAELSAEAGADRHEVGPSSASSVMPMSVPYIRQHAPQNLLDSTKTPL